MKKDCGRINVEKDGVCRAASVNMKLVIFRVQMISGDLVHSEECGRLLLIVGSARRSRYDRDRPGNPGRAITNICLSKQPPKTLGLKTIT